MGEMWGGTQTPRVGIKSILNGNICTKEDTERNLIWTSFMWLNWSLQKIWLLLSPSKRSSCEFSCLGERLPISISIKTPKRTFPIFPFKPPHKCSSHSRSLAYKLFFFLIFQHFIYLFFYLINLTPFIAILHFTVLCFSELYRYIHVFFFFPC